MSLLQTIRTMSARVARFRRHMGQEVGADDVTGMGVSNQVYKSSVISPTRLGNDGSTHVYALFMVHVTARCHCEFVAWSILRKDPQSTW